MDSYFQQLVDYSERCRRYEQLVQDNVGLCQEKFKALAGTAVRFEYGSGIDPWGYYCPNPVMEFTNGGWDRGRLRKSEKKARYKYGFDKDDNLVTIEICSDRKVFIEHTTHKMLGITFDTYDDCFGISEIVECELNSDKSVNTFTYLEPDENGKVQQLSHEFFTYENGRPVSAEQIFYLDDLSIVGDGARSLGDYREYITDNDRAGVFHADGKIKLPMLSATMFQFRCDEQGIICEYRMLDSSDDTAEWIKVNR